MGPVHLENHLKKHILKKNDVFIAVNIFIIFFMILLSVVMERPLYNKLFSEK